MPRFPEPDQFSHPDVEQDVLRRWADDETFERSLALREGAPHFVFYEGPPTANGKPGIHHVMARTIKDLFCRYKTMKGFRVDRKAGWDTHGLPVEIEVEKELGLEGRHAVEEYGVAAYNEACRESVLRYKDLWDELTVRMGYWVDLDDPYVTFETDYIESVWHLLKRISERTTPAGDSFLYKGYKIQWYSPDSGTVLSSHEVSLGYEETQDPSVVVRFPLHGAVNGEEGVSLLAWTTTPWTLPSNTALAVRRGIDYVTVRMPIEEGDPESGTETVLLASRCLDILRREDAEVIGHVDAADLLGRTYEPVFPHFKAQVGAEAAWRVVEADFVSTDDGTGIVHMAPAFGADDYRVGRENDLPLFNPIEPDGTFEEGFPLVGGRYFKDADTPLTRDLRERGLLLRFDSTVHNYPHDWRKGTPLMQYPVESWFIRTTAIKDRMVELNNTINWQPQGIGEGRFGQWLENNVDWAVSRMRYWATPLPIWVEEEVPPAADGSTPEPHVEVIGSIADLRAKCGGAFPEAALHPETGEIDLHRPYVDRITWEGPHGGVMRRVEDLLDVWFDSGAMPWAQWHAPFENEARFRANVPADFIAEGVDQTRGWFYTLHAIAALVDDRAAYKNVVVNGLVLDGDGNKMSKSKGNAVDPFSAIEEHGADPVRWMMMSASPPWESVRYDDRAVMETRRKVFGTLINTYRFFATYANLDGFDPAASEAVPVAERAELDRWVLSRLQSTIEEVDAAYDRYHPTRAARSAEAFIDDLSNWYVRRSRRRFWKEAADGGRGDADKRAAYQTLHTCLAQTAQLMAPLAPFTAEWLYRALGHDASVHLTDFPSVDAAAQDATLEGRMALARAVVTAALALRNEAQINVRQPLGTLSVVTGVGGVDAETLRAAQDIILDEVNVKELERLPADSRLIEKSAKPNFKALGRRLGPLMKAANAAIRDLSTEAVTDFERSGELTLDLDGEAVTLTEGDLEIVSEGVEGRRVGQETDATGRTVTVALSTEITPELRAEGLAREFVNRVQSLRKDAGFRIEDRITIDFAAPEAVEAAVTRHARRVRAETLAVSLTPAPEPTGETVSEVDLDGDAVRIGLRRIAETAGPAPA